MKKRTEIVILLALLISCAFSIVEKLGASASQERSPYTRDEYDAYNAAVAVKDAQDRVKRLDKFVSKYPNSALLQFAYQAYYATYNELKNYPKVIEYSDKTLSFGDRLSVEQQLQAVSARTLAFQYAFDAESAKKEEDLQRGREAALQGLRLLDQVKKPENSTEERFLQQKKMAQAFFHHAAGFASLNLKEYPQAVESFQAAIAANPNDSVTYFRLGIAHLQLDPPQFLEGLWEVARAIALKGPLETQARSYLRSQLHRYQLTVCQNLLDSQMEGLIALAAKTTTPPVGYTIPSAADLQKVRESSGGILDELKEGGERSQLVWLAICGLEFPEVVVKVIEVNSEGEIITLKVFRAPTQKEMEAGTVPNMEVRVPGQPDARRLKKDDWVRFTGTLVGFQPEPFLLSWEKAKVNPEDIPDERNPSAKKPGRKPPR